MSAGKRKVHKTGNGKRASVNVHVTTRDLLIASGLSLEHSDASDWKICWRSIIDACAHVHMPRKF